MGLVLQHQHYRSPVPHIQSLCWQLQYVTEASQRGITMAPFLCNLLSFGDPISDVLMQQIDSHTVTIYHLSLETVVTLFFLSFCKKKKSALRNVFFFSCRRVRVINSTYSMKVQTVWIHCVHLCTSEKDVNNVLYFLLFAKQCSCWCEFSSHIMNTDN